MHIVYIKLLLLLLLYNKCPREEYCFDFNLNFSLSPIVKITF